MATGQKKLRDPSERIARRLLGEGRISRDLYDAALRHRQGRNTRFEEALIDLGITEEQVLRLLAETYRVQFISTAKLSTAVIDKRTLALVPAQIAEQRQVVPVLLDRQRSVLTIVTSDPDDLETLKELEIATQVRTIRALVARPAAVEAAVRKFYLHDEFAFALLRQVSADAGADRDPVMALQEQRGEMMLDDEIVSNQHDPSQFSVPPTNTRKSAGAPGVGHGPPQAPSGRPGGAVAWRVPATVAPAGPPDAIALDPYDDDLPPSPVRRSATRTAPPTTRRAARGPSGDPPRRVSLTPPSGVAMEAPAPAKPEEAKAAAPPAAPATEAPKSPSQEATKAAAKEEQSAATNDLTTPDMIGEPFQLAVVMVSLLEGNRKDLRGHSIQTARLVNSVCERFKVTPSRTRAAEIAAVIHDLGKASSYHLTPYNVARFDGHRAVAQKLYTTPERVVETAKLAEGALKAVRHMYERYDGQGFPDGLKGNEIPLESRILAICDSYTDLTNNPRNSFRRVLSPEEACEALRELQGEVFDPKVINRFAHAVLGDAISQRLRGDLGTVLLVDPDVEETTVLELALLEKSYDVHVARAIDEALRFIESGEVAIVVAEMNLKPGNGFELLRKIRATTRGENLPFVFLSDENEGTKVAEALDAGAADYLFKPLATAVVVAKVRRILEQSQNTRRVRGVSGSLEEMGIPELVQILYHGRKSGALRLSTEGEEGTIFFKDGAIMEATWKQLKGEDAFYAIVGVTKGQFTVDPSVTPPEKAIQASPEMLLLEGMRRLDEASR